MSKTRAHGATGDTGQNGKRDFRQRLQLVKGVGRQIDAIYLQLDTQLTRMAQIQLQLDELRSKLKRL